MIIPVARGKGGTSKTLVATSLALSLKVRYRVRILDCDVEEPNDHIFLKPIIHQMESYCREQGVDIIARISFDNVFMEAIAQGLP